ncbi:MAG: HIT domain-containing protein [Clostridia bacterium]|nr:HIT domain-containing protein [Clostridia bacterium]
MKDCLFCKIVGGEIPAHKIFEDENTLAFLDIGGDFYGHTLVVPKVHCTNILDCPHNVLAAVMATVQKIAKHFVENCGFDGVNILANNNAAAQQAIMHLHIHIIPRKNGDFDDIYKPRQKTEFDLVEIQKQLLLGN